MIALFLNVSGGRVARTGGALCALFALIGFARPVHAALGDDVSAVEQDRVRMHASHEVRKRGAWDVHELTTAVGSTVREFVGPDGIVFAVSWSGGWRPDLRDMLGTHYDRFIAGTRGRRRTQGSVRVELPGMVVVMGGYLRTFFGHAYLSDRLPAGFSPEAIE